MVFAVTAMLGIIVTCIALMTHALAATEIMRPVVVDGDQFSYRPISLIGLDKRLPADLDSSRHRSVYLPVIRDRLPDVLEIFDFAEPSLVTGQRDETNVPVQALYLMNSDFVVDQSGLIAERAERETAGQDATATIRRCFQLMLSRDPDRDELAVCLEVAEQAGLAVVCRSLINTNEFAFLP